MTTLPKFCRQNSEKFLLDFRKWWKKINFPRNLFLFKMFVCSCTKKFWQDCRNFASKNTKQFPIVQIRWSYNFFIRICFHQKWFSSNGVATENAFLTTLPKNFFQKPQICHSDSKRREKLWIFWTEDYFSSNCASAHIESICDHPEKICRQNFENVLLEFRKGWKTYALSKQNIFSPKCSSEHAQWNFGKLSVTLLPKKRKTFPQSK